MTKYQQFSFLKIVGTDETQQILINPHCLNLTISTISIDKEKSEKPLTTIPVGKNHD